MIIGTDGPTCSPSQQAASEQSAQVAQPELKQRHPETDMFRFRKHHLHEKLLHMPAFGFAFTQAKKLLDLTAHPKPQAADVQSPIGRARSHSLPGGKTPPVLTTDAPQTTPVKASGKTDQ